MGMVMPAWYDILDMSQPRDVNWKTVADSHVRIEALVQDEHANKLVLAGFSQGAAMALHVGLRRQSSVAGILMMSGYLLENDEHPCPAKANEFPIAILHGSADPVVPLAAAEQAKLSLEAAGYSPTFKTYPGMQHSVCDEEIRDVFGWLSALV
jgi:phospholipase/carboxylesterase